MRLLFSRSRAAAGLQFGGLRITYLIFVDDVVSGFFFWVLFLAVTACDIVSQPETPYHTQYLLTGRSLQVSAMSCLFSTEKVDIPEIFKKKNT